MIQNIKEPKETDALTNSINVDSPMSVLSTEQHSELIALLSDLIRLPSENPPGREVLVEQYLIQYCEKNGLHVERIPVTSNRANLIITLCGESEHNPIAFTGHMDVVPVWSDERFRWNTDPYEPLVKDGWLIGRGAADMKGGLACVLLAMSELAHTSIRPSRTIHLLATCDEEDAMRGSRTLLHHPIMSELSDLVVCEPTGMTLCRCSRGRTYGELIIRGKTAHGSRPGEGVNTIDIAADIIRSLSLLNSSWTLLPKRDRDWMSQQNCYSHDDDMSQEVCGRRELDNSCGFEVPSYWQPLAIHAGLEPGIIPDVCRLRLDCRVSPMSSCNYEIERLNQILDEIETTHHVKAEFLVEDKREPWITASDHRLVLKIHSLGAFDETVFSGSTDANVLREAGLTPVIIGPGDLNDVHHENERVLLAELERAFLLYKSLML
ncbi:MAG TPA: M20 family metallopeptidase [Clostridiaceae bacterium]|nr:M20 family metallopeptidase [Clostridiaceae bacterium]